MKHIKGQKKQAPEKEDTARHLELYLGERRGRAAGALQESQGVIIVTCWRIYACAWGGNFVRYTVGVLLMPANLLTISLKARLSKFCHSWSMTRHTPDSVSTQTFLIIMIIKIKLSPFLELSIIQLFFKKNSFDSVWSRLK